MVIIYYLQDEVEDTVLPQATQQNGFLNFLHFSFHRGRLGICGRAGAIVFFKVLDHVRSP